jgi:hypothetical protein
MGTVLSDLLFGAVVENSTVTKHFDGWLDEVRIWSVARSGAEILADMNQTLVGSEPGLVGYWSFEEGAGDQALDLTANHNDGSLGASSDPDAADPVWSSDVPF